MLQLVFVESSQNVRAVQRVPGVVRVAQMLFVLLTLEC